MGLFSFIQTLLGKRDIVATAIKLLNEKVDIKNLATIFATYLVASKLASSFSEANNQAVTFAEEVALAVNLEECSDYNEVVKNLSLSKKQEASELGFRLTKAINLIKSIG